MTEPSGDTPGNILSVLNLSNWSYDFQERMEYYNDVLEHTWTINPNTVNTVAVFWNEQSAHNSAPTNDSSGKPMCFSRYINVTELPGQCWMEGFGVSGGAGGFSGGWTEPSQEVRNLSLIHIWVRISGDSPALRRLVEISLQKKPGWTPASKLSLIHI